VLDSLDGASSSDGVPVVEAAHGGSPFSSFISGISELLPSQVGRSDTTMELSRVDPMYVHHGVVVVVVVVRA